MTLAQLRYFFAVAEHLSFTKAAQTLYMTQPNLSKQIALLEREIGLCLFVRSNRSVKLTPSGEVLLKKLSGIPSQVDEALIQARAVDRSMTGSLSMGILEGQEINHDLANRLKAFYSAYPQIELNLERKSFRNLRNGLESGTYDIVISLGFDIEESDRLCRTVIMEQVEAIAINRSRPLAGKEKLSLSDLRDEPFVCIASEESPGGYSSFFKRCEMFGFTPKVMSLAHSLENQLLCVEAGIGAAILDRNTRLEKNENIRIETIPDVKLNLELVWRLGNENPAIAPLVKALSLEA